MPVDCMNGVRICGLHAYLKLDQSRTHFTHKLNFFIPKKICRNFKMEICHSVIMLQNVSPYFHRMLMPAVEGPVYKLDLRHSVIQKKLQFPSDQFQITKS